MKYLFKIFIFFFLIKGVQCLPSAGMTSVDHYIPSVANYYTSQTHILDISFHNTNFGIQIDSKSDQTLLSSNLGDSPQINKNRFDAPIKHPKGNLNGFVNPFIDVRRREMKTYDSTYNKAKEENIDFFLIDKTKNIDEAHDADSILLNIDDIISLQLRIRNIYDVV